MSINLSHVEAEEVDFVGTLPDDWAWTDRLAAEVGRMRRTWGKTTDVRNLTERAHNLRLLAQIATGWADDMETLEAELDEAFGRPS